MISVLPQCAECWTLLCVALLQMYTYYLRPVLVGHEATLTGGAAEEAARLDSSSVGDSTMNAAFLNEGLADSVHSWEVQLVLEYCDKGSLRALLNKQGTFVYQGGTVTSWPCACMAHACVLNMCRHMECTSNFMLFNRLTGSTASDYGLHPLCVRSCVS